MREQLGFDDFAALSAAFVPPELMPKPAILSLERPTSQEHGATLLPLPGKTVCGVSADDVGARQDWPALQGCNSVSVRHAGVFVHGRAVVGSWGSSEIRFCDSSCDSNHKVLETPSSDRSQTSLLAENTPSVTSVPCPYSRKEFMPAGS